MTKFKVGLVTLATMAMASAALAQPVIVSFWLAAKPQVEPQDDPHYYTNRAGALSMSPGALVYFTATAVGDGPLSYQWRFNSHDVPGATNSVYGYPGVQLAAGEYTVVVTDGFGLSVTNDTATLSIDPTFTKIVSDPVVTNADYTTGGTWADFNGDGYLDLYVYTGQDGVPAKSSVYRNNGNGTFTKTASGPWLNNLGLSTSACWGDYDNDGYPDLYAVSAAGNFFYHNLGNGLFSQIRTGSMVTNRVSGAANLIGANWADYDGDGFLDMFVMTFDPTFQSHCFLYRNNGDGTLSEITNSPLVQYIGSATGAAWGDYDGDGKPDLFVTGGGGRGASLTPNRLYHNDGHGTFTRIKTGSVVTDLGRSGSPVWVDYDNCGAFDLFVMNLPPQNSFLYHNQGDSSFVRVTNAIVVNNPSGWFDIGNNPPSCAWGDYDNDGFLDLYLTDEASGANGPVFVVNSLYHNNGDGTFTQVTTGSPVNEFSDSIGCAWVDYDNDGFLDLFASRGDGRGNFLYHNNGMSNGNTNSWLMVKLVGTVSNRSALGAKVRVRAFYRGASRWQLRQITDGSGALGHDELRAHFGLGDATNVDVVRIEWPSGIVQELHDVPPKEFLTITEPPLLSAGATNGAPQFALKAWRGMQYDILASGDLSTWATLGTIMVTNTDGTAAIVDTNSTTSDRRFYRGVSH